MGVIVAFDYQAWVLAYPQFSTIPRATVTDVILEIAEIYCRNDGGGPVSKAQTQQTLLWLMVAHVAQLLYGANGQSPSGIVGVITAATEGSVSVSANFPATQNNAWFLQTPFGAAFFAATASYRTMRYLPGPRRVFNPWRNQ
jgi:hypothetical protein